MKKILWLVNGMTYEIATSLGRGNGDLSWVTSMLTEIREQKQMSVHIVFPQQHEKEIVRRNIDGIKYYGVFQKEKKPWKTNKSLRQQFQKILTEIQPDVIHIWGTEYAHALDMVKATNSELRDRIIVHIQGLISVYAPKFMADLPLHVQYGYTFRDFLRNDNIKMQQKKFWRRGKNEIEILKNVNNVMGRTEWDKAHSLAINPNLEYYHCDESMRKEFFDYKWDADNIDKYSIFITQGNYPIKGFHYFLEALRILIKEFPQVHVRIAGADIMNCSGNRIRESSYSRYIRKYIQKNDLFQYIKFIGYQDVQGMINEYLSANVFVLPSAIENSPNSLAEAMVLGVPAVAADVGGVNSMAMHGKEVILYQHNDPVLLANNIGKLFRTPEMASILSNNARCSATKTYYAKNNVKVLSEIYDKLMV